MARLAKQPLLNPLTDLGPYQQLLEEIKAGQFRDTTPRGLALPRSVRLALVASLHNDLKLPLVLLTNRADRALGLLDELHFWLPEGSNYYFPEPNPLFYEKLPWSESTRRERLQVFSMLARYHLPGFDVSETTPPVIVAPVRAVMTRSIPRRDFLRAVMRLKLGDHNDLHAITANWVGIGYEYSNIVVQPGQFSRRGGILDIWSPSDPMPIRVEFFGDEIDTLRYFNPASQRTETNLEHAEIFPASEAMPAAAEKLGMPLEEIGQLSELSIPSLYAFPSSLIDYLPSEAIILLDGQEFVQAAVNDIEEESMQRFQSMVEQRELPADAPVPYITWSEIEDGFSNKQVIELGHTNALEGSALAARFDPGPRFAGRLKDFQTHLRFLEDRQQDWTVVSRQSARLRQLWQETHPDYSNEQGLSQFIEGSLSGGWVLKQSQHHAHHLLTDSEIFGWSRPQPRRRPLFTSEVARDHLWRTQPR